MFKLFTAQTATTAPVAKVTETPAQREARYQAYLTEELAQAAWDLECEAFERTV